MNIVCLIHSLDGGGAERVMAGLASRLARRGHSVTLVTLDDAGNDRHAVDSDVNRLPLDVMGESHSIVSAVFNNRHRVAAIRRAIADVQPDVVLSFCDRTNILGLMATVPLGIPIVVSERSDPSGQNLGRVWEWMRRRYYPRATTIVTQTATSAAHLGNLLGRPVGTPTQVIASAVDTPPFASDRSLATANRRILAVGRLEYEKGFDRLIEAFAIVGNTFPDWTLRILGEGSRRPALENQIRELGLATRISMPGWVRPVWEELAEATIFALPSRYEGFPSALLEALAVGVPSIAVDCESGPRAIIEDSKNGLLVTNDVAGLASGINRLIADSNLRETIGAAGKRVIDRFGWEAMVDAYERVLQEAV